MDLRTPRTGKVQNEQEKHLPLMLNGLDQFDHDVARQQSAEPVLITLPLIWNQQ
jgi:hypothetical protein